MDRFNKTYLPDLVTCTTTTGNNLFACSFPFFFTYPRPTTKVDSLPCSILGNLEAYLCPSKNRAFTGPIWPTLRIDAAPAARSSDVDRFPSGNKSRPCHRQRESGAEPVWPVADAAGRGLRPRSVPGIFANTIEETIHMGELRSLFHTSRWWRAACRRLGRCRWRLAGIAEACTRRQACARCEAGDGRLSTRRSRHLRGALSGLP